jgi:hypothetical protein
VHSEKSDRNLTVFVQVELFMVKSDFGKEQEKLPEE